jgi:hypothetical protein
LVKQLPVEEKQQLIALLKQEQADWATAKKKLTLD